MAERQEGPGARSVRVPQARPEHWRRSPLRQPRCKDIASTEIPQPMSIKVDDAELNAALKNMLSCRHTGFHVHIGARIWPEDENALGNLAKYILRASFSQARMLYIPAEKSADGVAKVVYTSKDAKIEQTFDVLDWLARIVVHIPNKYEQLVRYLRYSNKSRGMRKKAGTDDVVASIAPGEMASKKFRRNWARPIQKILSAIACLRGPEPRPAARGLRTLFSSRFARYLPPIKRRDIFR